MEVVALDNIAAAGAAARIAADGHPVEAVGTAAEAAVVEATTRRIGDIDS